MSYSDPKYLVKQVFLLPIGLAWLALQIVQELTAVARKYARYWLTIMFALPLVILSSDTLCVVWVLVALVSRGWIPWSAWIRQVASNTTVYLFLFAHGSLLKLLFLALGLYAFGPVPAPALHFVALDLEATAGWLKYEILDAGPPIGASGQDWVKFLFYCMAYRQFTNVLAKTEAWETIVTGSVLKPQLMRIVIHFQVIYAIAVLCWLRRQLFDIRAEVREESQKEEFFRRFMHEYSQFKAGQGDDDEQDAPEEQPQHGGERPRASRKRRGKPRKSTD